MCSIFTHFITQIINWYLPTAILNREKKVEVIKVQYSENVSCFPAAKERVGLHKDDKKHYYLVNDKPVLKHGQFEVYHPNGNLWMKGYYVNGINVGAHQYFNQSGNIMARAFYKSNGKEFYCESYDLTTGELISKRKNRVKQEI